jgi:hypothetical protein
MRKEMFGLGIKMERESLESGLSILERGTQCPHRGHLNQPFTFKHDFDIIILEEIHCKRR